MRESGGCRRCARVRVCNRWNRGVAAGSVVSVLQSIGAAGVVAGPVGVAAGAIVGFIASRRYQRKVRIS